MIKVSAGVAPGSLMNIAALASSILADTEQSLIEYTSVVRQEPVVLIEDGLTHLDVTPNLLKTLTNLYMAYYLQAVSINNHVGDCSVMSTLDKFATHRSLSNAVGTFIEKTYGQLVPSKESFADRIQMTHSAFPQLKQMSLESAKLCYPSVRNQQIESYQLSAESLTQSFESDEVEVPVEGKEFDHKTWIKTMQDKHGLFYGVEPTGDEKQQIQQAKVAADVLNASTKMVHDAPNLAVGKMFNVTIENNGRSAVIPVSVRLNSMDAHRLLMMKILAQGDLKNTWKERWNRWREGELRFFKDLILCHDLLAEHATLMKADKHGLYKQILKTRRNNKLAEAMTGNVSIAAASSIAIVSKDLTEEMRFMIGGGIENETLRANIFARCGLMFLVVVDPALQYATIYHRGIKNGMELTFSELGKLGKGTGPDTLDMLRAFQAGQRPNL